MRFFVLYTAIASWMPGFSASFPVKGTRSLQGDEARKGAPSSSSDDDACSSGAADGYKQVNTLLSHAYFNLARDGTLFNLCLYNNGLPTPEGWAEVCRGTNETNPDGDSCTRRWDNSEAPAGILAEAICAGTFKWCVNEGAFGDSLVDGFIVMAEKDNFLEGIQIGDMIGGSIPAMKALTIEMGKILHASLQMEVVAVGGNVFDGIVDAMASNLCYATTDIFFRHPYREATADFTCPTFIVPPSGFGILALESNNLDLEAAFTNAGEGIKVCKPEEGTTQAALIERDFSNAEFVEMPLQGSLAALCAGECDAVVDEIQNTQNNLPTTTGCSGKMLSTLQIASPSSAGDVGAITYRAP